jgi:hypothetical protein
MPCPAALHGMGIQETQQAVRVDAVVPSQSEIARGTLLGPCSLS